MGILYKSLWGIIDKCIYFLKTERFKREAKKEDRYTRGYQRAKEIEALKL